MYHNKYWRELDQLKVHVFYLERYLERTIKIERAIKMFLAITSSASIAGWAVWQEYSFAWGGIIALSQVVNAVKSHLPYSRRLKSLFGITNDLESLFLSMESGWFGVSEGKLTEEEIHGLQMRYKSKRRQIIEKHLARNPLPELDHLLEKAKQNARIYFTNFYTTKG